MEKRKAIEGFYQSRFLIYMGEWEKGKTIVSFLGGVKKKPNYLEAEVLRPGGPGAALELISKSADVQWETCPGPSLFFGG